MKGICLSHSNTRSDPHLMALTNRIAFIQRRRHKIHAEIKNKIITQINSDSIDSGPPSVQHREHHSTN